ncbi:MAG: 4-hydroxythreonine-4-phosphate dehydrogenase PdxA [Prevotella sp.]|nr:4-hydroxythreonine-4-phosphate dehydrogenase PdxA [Prevotella sp.]
MENRKIRVAITHGDTNGIGYEVILRAFEDPMMLDMCTPIIYGSPKLATFHRKAMGMETQFAIIKNAEEAKDGRVNLIATLDEEVPVEFGKPTEVSNRAAKRAVDRAKEDMQKRLYDVLVLGPVVSNPNPKREDRSLTIMLSDRVRIGLLTNHLPIKDVAQSITIDKIVEKGKIFNTSLKRDFRVNNPRIAVLALNPHTGTEEEQIITPAIAELEKQNVQAFGPYAAEEFFACNNHEEFDGVLAMYDDQGLLPFNSLAPEYGVKLKAGITAICTTTDHGPSFEIAGKGIADPTSLRQAVYTAVDMYRHRQEYDEPLANPLPKLYHEKREDGDKARFAMPRAKDLFKKTEPKNEE